jgi:hypothetical protein
MRTPLALSAVLLAAALVLTGCRGEQPTMDPNLTVEQAKADTQRFELVVAEAIPADLVERVEQMEKGSLLECGANDAFVWTGNLKIYLKDPASSTHLLQDLADEFEGSFSEEAGRPETQIVGPEGQDLLITLRDDGDYLNFSSGSACFQLDEGQWSGDLY